MPFEEEAEQRIKEIIQRRGQRCRTFCRKSGISRALENKRHLNTGEFLAVCRLLNLKFDDFRCAVKEPGNTF